MLDSISLILVCPLGVSGPRAALSGYHILHSGLKNYAEEIEGVEQEEESEL